MFWYVIWKKNKILKKATTAAAAMVAAIIYCDGQMKTTKIIVAAQPNQYRNQSHWPNKR